MNNRFAQIQSHLRLLSLLMVLVGSLSVSGCVPATDPSDSSTSDRSEESVANAYADLDDESTERSAAVSSEEQVSTAADVHIIQELGSLDRAPINFKDEGWILQKNGEYSYIDVSGTPIVENRGFDAVHLWPETNGPVNGALLYKNGEFTGPGKDCALLPDPEWPDNKAFGGGGVVIRGTFSYDGENLHLTDVPEGCDEEDVARYPMTLYSPDVTESEAEFSPFYVWLPQKKIISGYEPGDKVSFFHQNPQMRLFSYDDALNFDVGNLFVEQEEDGLYIISLSTSTSVGPFDSVEMTDPDFMGARKGNTYIFFDGDLNELYRADIESGGAPIGNTVPVCIDGTWSLVTLDSLKESAPSYSRAFPRVDLELRAVDDESQHVQA